jgi:predicted AlkP superfamily pyrophosphatase or phosphodiesterase
LGVIVESIKFSTRFSKEELIKYTEIKDIFNLVPVSNRIKTKFFHINNKDYCYAPFSFIASKKKSEILPYKNLDDFFKQTEKAIRKNGKKYIISYYPEPDRSIHKYGTKSEIPLKELKEIDKKLKAFLEKINGTNTTVIITADHGLKDTTKRLNFENYPELKEMLVMPMTGESGVAYCYVKNSKKREFEKYVKSKLKNACELYESEELIKRGYFGKGKIHPELLNRVGDYTLLMKGEYASGSKLINSSNHENLGGHGGATKEEMFVLDFLLNRKILNKSTKFK